MRIVRFTSFGFLLVLLIAGVCLADCTGLLGEVVSWPSAMGPARRLDTSPYPAEDETLFAARADAMFGCLHLGNGPDTAIAVAFVGGDSPRLWVDANNNEDLTDDGTPEWSDSYSDSAFEWKRRLHVSYTSNGIEHTAEYEVNVIALRDYDRWDLFYSSHCLRKGLLWTGEEALTVWLGDMDSDGLYDDLENLKVIVDVNGDDFPAIDHSIPETFYPEFFLGEGQIQIHGTTFAIDAVSADGMRVEASIAEVQLPPLPYVTVGREAPAFEVETADGQSLSLVDLQGKFVILAFAPIQESGVCASCTASAEGVPRICDLASELRSSTVQIIAVSTYTDPPVVSALQCAGVDVPLVWGQALFRSYRPRAYWLIVIGPDGVILGKDAVRPIYDSSGNVAGAEDRPLRVPEILELIYDHE